MTKFKSFSFILIAVVCVLFSFGVSGENNATKAKTTATSTVKKIKVIARLVELEGKMAPNDLYNYVFIMKYKVVSVVEGELKEKVIYVGHYNPLMPRKLIKDKMKASVTGTLDKFVVGDKHELILSPGIETFWDGPVEDEYFDDPDVRYFALSVKKVP